ncbi:hypothetical protein [Nitrosovibrio sp. Nv17]|uniref:hypothetical protein n=1 Tax=Nitrosovibrio sp. Nv17 TaxID=1855339 RepID=UPI000908D7A2|nr:hypothetical protein [Nitrosovibrio sp. Nv17]SFW17564.1 hypothetical protein SAMN05216414_10440 [Nitrosovibrio sp. Nv17]
MNASPIANFTWPGRLHGDPAHDLIVAYLVVDIQKNLQWAEELLRKTRAVGAGEAPFWERMGNAYWLRLYPDHAEIEEDYAAEPGSATTVPLGEFEAAVVAWRAFLALRG